MSLNRALFAALLAAALPQFLAAAPAAVSATASAGAAAPTSSMGASASASGAAATASAAEPGLTVTVKAGDTLGILAEEYLGKYGRWREIAEANGLSKPYDLTKGQVLVLPKGAKFRPLPEAEHRSKPAAASDAVPDFTLTDVSTGKPFHLRDHLGEAVLIDFWATWCGPCRMAIPHLIELQKKYGGRNFTVVGVSLDQQGEGVVRPFTQQWNINYPVVVDQDGSVARDYGGIRSIPSTLVIDRTGRAVGSLIGYRPLEEYEALVKKALKAG